MNLKVDLIVAAERRSASLISAKLVIRIVSLAVPLLVFLAGGLTAKGIVEAAREVESLEAQWLSVEPRKAKALQTKEMAERSQRTVKEMEGWRSSRVDWHAQLIALRQGVSSNIQLTTLRVGQTLQLINDRTPARTFSMFIDGRAVGAEAQEDVDRLRRHMAESVVCTACVEEAKVTRFAADPNLRDERVFAIDVKYKPAKFQ